ncbi:hypothetical protein [Olsenella uli]|uniref:hypothetical protein n=1 Tax=Olsenella uli TaxID=133926 RepID=UPI0028E28C3A|nr:hypothetical protein [Olsenella uli]
MGDCMSSLCREISRVTECAVEADGGWELWDSGKCVGGDAAARHWAWHVSPGRLAVMRDADGRAVAFDRYACVGADWPDVVEDLTGHRMERPW